MKMIPTRICVLATHPIQYIAPWYRALASDKSLKLEVVFLREPNSLEQGEGFDRPFHWDVPLRQGYGSQVIGVGRNAFEVLCALIRLVVINRQLKPDVWIVTGWNEPILLAACLLFKVLRRPLILRGEANAMRARGTVKKFGHRLLLGLADALLLIGESNKKFYLENSVPISRLFDGAYFVDSMRILKMALDHKAARELLRSEAGISDHDFVFLFFGKHVTFKRPEFAILAASKLVARGHSVKVLFGGVGPLTPALEALARARGVPAIFLGFLNQTELWRAYLAADAFILPSTNQETWGLVVNEAMLFGLPVIVSDQVGCGPDLVINGETGFLFSGGVDQLACVMERLVDEPDRGRAMGERGRSLVLERYSMQRATAGLRLAVDALAGCRQ